LAGIFLHKQKRKELKMATLHATRSTVWKPAITYGVLSFIGFVVIFLICKFLGLIEHTELRLLNFLLLFYTAFMAIKSYKTETHNAMNYFEGLAIGFLVPTIAFILFGGFMIAYLHIDEPFLEYLIANSPVGLYPTPLHSGIMMASEGIGAGIIIALILMQYFKQNRTN